MHDNVIWFIQTKVIFVATILKKDHEFEWRQGGVDRMVWMEEGMVELI